jgi:hypothetical protein
MSDDAQIPQLEVEGDDVVGLYVMLKRQEDELDWSMNALLNRVERELFRHLSIEEMESLEERYARGESLFSAS